MTILYTLASGSEGNCTLIKTENKAILVDAGISCRRINQSLELIGQNLNSVDAIFITHEHSDHIGGLQTLVKRYTPRIYANSATCRQLSYRIAGIEPLLVPLEALQICSLDEVTVRSFATSHDSACAQDYRFDTDDGSIGFITDTGYVTDQARETLRGVDLLLLEANHDETMLLNGSYPYPTKMRILSDHGHLSNTASADFAEHMAMSGTSEIILAHISKHNNTEALALDTVSKKTKDYGTIISLAPRSEMSRAYKVKKNAENKHHMCWQAQRKFL